MTTLPWPDSLSAVRPAAGLGPPQTSCGQRHQAEGRFGEVADFDPGPTWANEAALDSPVPVCFIPRLAQPFVVAPMLSDTTGTPAPFVAVEHDRRHPRGEPPEGDVAGRAFVDTVSFGAYADVVQHPEYRDDKSGTALDPLPDPVIGDSVVRLDTLVDDTALPARQAPPAGNNQYNSPDGIGAAGRRPASTPGELGVLGVQSNSTRATWASAPPGTRDRGFACLPGNRRPPGARSERSAPGRARSRRPREGVHLRRVSDRSGPNASIAPLLRVFQTNLMGSPRVWPRFRPPPKSSIARPIR
ncbi:hypothetical protein [Embleya sp. NPDC020630]|uniref:hypothetical protein n=1 Tax=Embleya sp. NPDC020630 TaxID=3363979 RepID=UPI0037A3BEAC